MKRSTKGFIASACLFALGIILLGYAIQAADSIPVTHSVSNDLFQTPTLEAFINGIIAAAGVVCLAFSCLFAIIGNLDRSLDE